MGYEFSLKITISEGNMRNISIHLTCVKYTHIHAQYGETYRGLYPGICKS